MGNAYPFPRLAALIAGLGLLVMVGLGPFGLFTIDALQTATTPEAALALAAAPRFLFAIIAFAVIALLDVVIAIALNAVFRNGAPGLSRIAMVLRIVYAVALMLLVIYLLRARGATDGLEAQGLVAAFARGWLLSLGVFGLHLITLGIAGLRLPALPTAIGWLLVLAGIGYSADTLGALVLPGYALNLSSYLFLGELVLMVWLIFRGMRPPRATP